MAKRYVKRIDDDIQPVYCPPANPQFGFRGSWYLRVKSAETVLDRDAVEKLVGGLRNVIADLTPWQDMKR